MSREYLVRLVYVYPNALKSVVTMKYAKYESQALRIADGMSRRIKKKQLPYEVEIRKADDSNGLFTRWIPVT